MELTTLRYWVPVKFKMTDIMSRKNSYSKTFTDASLHKSVKQWKLTTKRESSAKQLKVPFQMAACVVTELNKKNWYQL
jgi:hypothetical protein